MELSRAKVKRGILLSVSVSIIAIIIVLIFTQDEFSFKAFTHIDIKYLFLAIYITLMFWFLKSLKLRLLVISMGGNISLLKMFNIYLASAFVAHITPSSSGGLPFVIYFIHREGLPLGKSIALTVLDNIFSLIFYLIAAPILLLAWGEYLNLGPVIGDLFHIALILVIGFILAVIVLIFNTQLALTFINWLTSFSFIKNLFPEKKLAGFREYIKKEVDFFNEGLEILSKNKKDLFLIIIYTILYWLFYLTLPLVLLRGLGVNVGFPPVILAQLVFNFIQPIIPTPGGSGGAELSIAYLFKFMVPSYLLGIFVALWRFFVFYISLIVGGILFVKVVQGTEFLENK